MDRGALDFKKFATTAYDDLSHRSTQLKKLLESLDIRVHGSSRIENYHRVLSNFLNTAKKHRAGNSLDLRLLQQAIFELDQITFIAEEFTKTPPTGDWKTSLQTIISGHELPQKETDKTLARNIQFQLYVAAVLTRAGYPVELAEPDIIVRDTKGTVGIANKRVKSKNQLEKRIREARKQIDDVDLDGIIALDITQIVNRRNLIPLVDDKDEITSMAERSANSFVQRNQQRLSSCVKSTRVFGILVSVSNLCFVRSKPQLASATRWTVSNLCDSTDTRYDFLRSLVTRVATTL